MAARRERGQQYDESGRNRIAMVGKVRCVMDSMRVTLETVGGVVLPPGVVVVQLAGEIGITSLVGGEDGSMASARTPAKPCGGDGAGTGCEQYDERVMYINIPIANCFI